MSEKITEENFQQTVQEKGGLVLVDFWAPWCGPCQVLGPIIEEVSQEIKDKAVVGKVNVDNNQNLAVQFGIRGIPTVILFKEGKPVEQLTGVRQKEDYLKVIEEHSA